MKNNVLKNGGKGFASLNRISRPPESMRPDRPEVITEVGLGKTIEIERGVRFECLVGSHNQSRNLTTGIVTFDSGAKLPYHHHSFGESVTLIQGQAIVEVEGRRYSLDPLDNVTIPRGHDHHVVNTSTHEPAVFNIMMATDTPIRTIVDRSFSRHTMSADSTGHPGAERVTRFKTAYHYEPGPNTSFVDFFNRELLPEIEMSGGYGLFQHGGRLPAHVHDFDESICIIDGTATCVVEGRNYKISDSATALQPRGRVHYFINETHEPMAMLWVYAGPMPERMVLDEVCATEEGNPWK